MKITRRRNVRRPAWSAGLVARVLLFLAAAPCAAPLLRASELGAEWGLDRISEDAAQDHLRFLTDDARRGREAGTVENRAVMDYLAGQFEALGLEPAGEHGTYFQFFPEGAIRSDQGSTLATAAGGATTELVWNRDFRAQRDGAQGEGEAGLVFAGFGIETESYSDYTGQDVKDQAVLMLRGGALPKKLGLSAQEARFFAREGARVRIAQDHGAKAVLFVHRADWAHPDLPVSVLPVGQGRRPATIPVFHVSRAAAARLLGADGAARLGAAERELAETGKPRSFAAGAVLRWRVTLAESRPGNVIGLLKGSDQADEYVVVGGHLDHVGMGGFGSTQRGSLGQVHNGADDNASGTASVLLAARALAQARTRPRRSILFMGFNAEEKGLLGAAAFVRAPTVPRAGLKAMINLDMVGRLREGKLSVSGVGSWARWRPILERCHRALDPQSATLKPSWGEGAGGADSDHWPFLRAGVPALFFFTGMHPEYHGPPDDLALLNVEGLVAITRLVSTVVWATTNYEGVPELSAATRDELQRRGRGGGRGNRVLVGIVPAPGVEGLDGVEVAEVMPGYAAEAAGLEPGDVIVALDGTATPDVRALGGVLAGKKVGDPLEITWLRGTERLTKTVEVTSGE